MVETVEVVIILSILGFQKLHHFITPAYISLKIPIHYGCLLKFFRHLRILERQGDAFP